MPSASAVLRVSSAYPDDQLVWPWFDLVPPLGLQHFGEAVDQISLGARGTLIPGPVPCPAHLHGAKRPSGKLGLVLVAGARSAVSWPYGNKGVIKNPKTAKSRRMWMTHRSELGMSKLCRGDGASHRGKTVDTATPRGTLSLHPSSQEITSSMSEGKERSLSTQQPMGLVSLASGASQSWV